MGHIEIVETVIHENGVTEIVIPWDEMPDDHLSRHDNSLSFHLADEILPKVIQQRPQQRRLLFWL